MEYKEHFEQSVNEGNLVSVIEVLYDENAFSQLLQDTISEAMSYGYSFKNHLAIRNKVYLVFELDTDFLKQLGSFMERFNEELEDNG